MYLLSNAAEITDADAVLEILRGYHCSVRFAVRREGTGGRGTVQVAEDGYPQALKVADFPDEVGYDAGVWAEDLHDAFDELANDGERTGNKGFLALLLELAPYLATPLRIFGCSERGLWDAGLEGWTVQPGAKEVLVEYFPPRERELDSLISTTPWEGAAVEVRTDAAEPLAVRPTKQECASQPVDPVDCLTP